ncbi:MAG: DUF4390 domain-containing protein [Gammaproteobacteria bacterium]
MKSNRIKTFLLAGLIVVSGWMLQFSVFASEFVIRDASSKLMGDNFVISADIDYQFSEVALEALENGVPLLVDVHVQVRRKGAWIWEKDVVDRHFQKQIRYLPLSATYQVITQSGSKKTQFISRQAALSALGSIDEYPVVKASDLEKDETYEMEIKTELDIEALPVPLRPKAYMSPDWKLSSEWSQWLLKP